MRIVIAEDLYLLRDGLARLVESAGHTVAATAATGPETLKALLEVRPDLAIVDVRMPPTNTDEGLRAALAARAQIRALPVLILSQHVETLYARELLADRSGGVGYLLKESVFDADQFLDAIDRVAGGGTALDPAVVARMLTPAPSAGPLDTLTDRERSIIALMAEGLSNHAIAIRLYLSDGAVSKYTTTAFDKLGINDDNDTNRRVLAVLAHLNQNPTAR
jgi:DNA-binding NarL/FixJ family response regulator